MAYTFDSFQMNMDPFFKIYFYYYECAYSFKFQNIINIRINLFRKQFAFFIIISQEMYQLNIFDIHSVMVYFTL